MFGAFFTAGKNQVKSDRFPVTLGEWYTLQMQAEVIEGYHNNNC